jgi:hypothetical protein
VLALVATTTPVPLTTAGYADALEAMAAALDRGDWDAAREQARSLRGTRVEANEGVFEADPTVLAAVETATDAPSALRARHRIGRVVQSLGRRDTAVAVDGATLARLARQEAARRPIPGGEVDGRVAVHPPSVPEQIREWLASAWDWVARQMERLWDWLTRRPRRRAPEADGSTATVVTVLVAVIVAALALFAVRSLRRRDPALDGGEPHDAAAAARDENPLSREADEWERYAAELAAAGRRREAVRAWYHAVLVALFRTGRLHHQKGRTNWEYVAQLDPGRAWQPGFVDLTQTFDREWYGRAASSVEALRECAARAREILRVLRAEARS